MAERELQKLKEAAYSWQRVGFLTRQYPKRGLLRYIIAKLTSWGK